MTLLLLFRPKATAVLAPPEAPSGGGGRRRRKQAPRQTYIYRGIRGRPPSIKIQFQWSAYFKVKFKAINWRKARTIKVKFITHVNDVLPVRIAQLMASRIGYLERISFPQVRLWVSIEQNIADVFKVKIPTKTMAELHIPLTLTSRITLGQLELDDSLARKYRLQQLKMLADTLTSLV